MPKGNPLPLILAGAAAGTVAGLFGAGGGLVLVPLLTLLTNMDQKEIFPSSLSVIMPICLISLIAAVFTQPIPWQDTLPYLVGSAAGGLAAGWIGQKIPVSWLHRALGILILWGGFRNLC